MSHAASKARQPTRHHVLTLYRRLLQQSTAFKDYNFRETALRKTKEQVRHATARRHHTTAQHTHSLFEQSADIRFRLLVLLLLAAL